MLFIILKSGHMSVTNLGQNSFGHFGASRAFLTEFILTFIFILVILVVTNKKGNGVLVTGIVIGLSLPYYSFSRYTSNRNVCKSSS